jgi:hypothetical protein
MHFRILPDHQKNVLKKDIFDRLEWLKTCFDAFAQTPRPPETFVQKRYFYCLEWLKTCFNAFAHMYFQPTKNFFCIKDIFESLEWLKTCFDAFAHTPRPPETVLSKKIFLKVWSE